MRHAWGSRVGMITLIGFMVLSAGLVLLPDRTSADRGDKPDKGGGSATDLSGVTQNWDKNLPSNSRFAILPAFNNEAVRDNNTGLVWERIQDLAPHTWVNATWYCANKIVGGTVGWRLPSIVELASVQDLLVPSPYINSVFNFPGTAPAGNWWSATTSDVASTDAWIMDIGGRVNGNSKANGQGLAWCVRGPMNANTY
jgi:hypothetical protein